jgi:type I restriction enzyme S subunit
MKKYQSYKTSGLEWLETVPEHWSISRLKYLGDLYGGLTGKSGIDFNNDENPKNKPYIPYTNIFNNTYISKDHYHYVSIDEGENQNRVRKYDLFFLMSSETHKDLGKSCILIEDVDELYLNSFCKGFRIKDNNIYPLFLNYQILGHLHREMISYEGKGFTRINLRQDKLNDLFIFYPPISEQHQIVQFLNEKTDLIDKLISTKERKIELLKHQRTSLFNEVITKGINPKVKMKDSGVEWIGEIPEHWSLKPFKYLIKNLNSGVSVNSDNNPVETTEELGVLKTSSVYGDVFRPEENKKVVIEEYNRVSCPVVKNSIIISRMNTPDLVGSSGYVEMDYPNLFLPDRLWITEFSLEFNICVKYYSYLLRSDRYKKILSTRSTGTSSSMKNISKDDLLTLHVPFFDFKEQKKISDYIDEQTSLIENTILIEQKKIDLLKEYRKSLISEVITGKIDVRTNLN